MRCQGAAVVALDLAGPLIARETADREMAEAWDLVARLSVLYEVLSPPEPRR